MNLTAGAHKFSELSLPQGYELVRDDTFTVANSADIIPVTVRAAAAEEEVTTAIANVQFVDADGNAVGGGYYTLPAGVQNISILSQYVPEGYTLAEAGDFYVAPDGFYQAKVVKAESSIIHVTFKSTGGKALGGGDYFVDEDGDGIANYSELQLPEGYNLTETGDFFVDPDQNYEITLKKEVEGTIIHVVYVDEEGNNLGGGDYFVDLDDDGIANYSELALPEGYELIQTGDFFVDANNPYTITLHKVQTHEVEQDTASLVVKYVKEGTNEVVGEDSLKLDVEYGQSAEAFVKVKAVEDKNEGKKDEEKADEKKDSKKEDKGVDTGVATPLAGIFGTMSVALGGMIALLRRKNRK